MMDNGRRKNPKMIPLHQSRAIIVLGCRPFQDDGSINVEIQARVGKGVEVYQRGFGDKIIFSGGTLLSDVPEAAVMKSLAKMVPKKDIVLELHAKSTVENAVYTKRLVLKHGIKEVIIVTSPYHVDRAIKIFKRVYGPLFRVEAVESDFALKWPNRLWKGLIEWAKWWHLAPERFLQRLNDW